jgi:hypothetical protein
MYWAQISENKKATNPTMKHNIDFQSCFLGKNIPTSKQIITKVSIK